MAGTYKQSVFDKAFEKFQEDERLPEKAGIGVMVGGLLLTAINAGMNYDMANALDNNINNGAIVIFVDGKKIPHNNQEAMKELLPALLIKNKDDTVIELKKADGSNTLRCVTSGATAMGLLQGKAP